jgi:hypothetical protein
MLRANEVNLWLVQVENNAKKMQEYFGKTEQ